MKTKMIEATNGPRQNWGKFVVCRFDQEWERNAKVGAGFSLLKSIGWGTDHVFVLDLQTCEGAGFRPGGSAFHDLEKHRIWVCPLFFPFLEWLYKQDLSDLDRLPDSVDLPDAEFIWRGHRRPGPLMMGMPIPQGGEVEGDCEGCHARVLKPKGDDRPYVCLKCLGPESKGE